MGVALKHLERLGAAFDFVRGALAEGAHLHLRESVMSQSG